MKRLNYTNFPTLTLSKMSDWDLLTPGIGLSAIGAIGVGISLSGLAKTFIDGMHALTFLTMTIGLIFLVAGLFKDGFPTSKKSKVATAISLTILVGCGFLGAISISGMASSIFIYIFIMTLISVPAAAIVVAFYRNHQKMKILYGIFLGMIIIGVVVLYSLQGFTQSTDASSPSSEAGEVKTEVSSTPTTDVSKYAKVDILAGSSAQGNPDYGPDVLQINSEPGITWRNVDNVPHTVTSLKDDGKTFDSQLIMKEKEYSLDITKFPKGTYEYFCTIHPYMKASFIIN